MDSAVERPGRRIAMPPRFSLVGLLAVLTVVCGGRGQPAATGAPVVEGAGAEVARLSEPDPVERPAATEVQEAEVPAPPSRAPANLLRFRPYASVDEEGLGIEAFHMLVPVGWEVRGGVRWRQDNPAFPAYGAFAVSNPERLEELEIFPNLPMFWTDNQGLLAMFPVGSKYFGNVVHPPLGAAAALRQLVLPQFRGGVSGLTFVDEAAVPELALTVQEMQARAQPEAGIRADAARVRVRYTWNGAAVEEELYAVVQSFAYGMQTMQGVVTNQNWWVDYVFSFKAAAGHLDEAAKALQTIAFSVRLDPRWFAGYGRLVEALIQGQIRQIRHIGELGRRYAQAGSEIREAELRRWEADQAVRDRLADDWSRQFRGYDRYWDPAGERMVELPSGYDNAWVNNLGEVVMADDPSFNPNIGSNLHWQPMPRQ